MISDVKAEAVRLYNDRRLNEALDLFRKAQGLDPHDNEIPYYIGVIYLQNGEYNESVNCFSQMVKTNPSDDTARSYLGISLGASGNYQEAVSILQQVLENNPIHMNAMMGLASCYQMMGNQVGAVVEYRKIIDKYPGDVGAHIRLGDTCLAMGNLDGARTVYKQALNLHPGDEDAIAGLAAIALRCNNRDSAYELILPLIEGNSENVSIAILFSEICTDTVQCNESIDRLNKILRSNGLTHDLRQKLQFALGSAYDKMHLYDKAFEAYTAGNRLIKITYDPAESQKVLDRYIKLWGRDLLKSLRTAGRSEKKPQPVFIVGMPRSGTSLLEHMLASHPLVTACGEQQLITNLTAALPSLLKTATTYPECIREAEKESFPVMAEWYLDEIGRILNADSIIATDKAPLNFWHLGFVQLLFPDAKILHCVRNPLDCSLSNYFQNFTGRLSWASDLASLGDYFRKYQRLMQHWNAVLDVGILDVRYENMVTRAEETCREVLDFCGLPWDDRCLRHHETDRPVVTASYGQVFKPLYNTSIDRWKNYDQHLAQLHESLGM